MGYGRNQTNKYAGKETGYMKRVHTIPNHIIGKYKELWAKNSSLYVTIWEDESAKFRILICDRKRRLIISEQVINPHVVEIIDNLRVSKRVSNRRRN